MSSLPPPVTATATEHWRPHYHFSPRRHWANDPNGLVFHDGEYHLYFQHNPQGEQWGHISWGHAVSTDLVSWQELPVALPATERVMAFSGSVVVDHANAGGFAPPGSAEPAFVAFFTGFDPVTKIQSQHLAYSLDRGRSYTPYDSNPIIDIGSTEFRDPKVFWHAPTQRWVMLVVAALRQEVWIYTSSDLKNWTRTSTFGPAGSAANNIWEVPDLFELPVRAKDRSAAGSRWVLVVSVNHGTPWGGSGVQYFVGHFDGVRFSAEPSGTVPPLTAPEGDLVADFEGGRLAPGWRIDGPAFGTGPVSGSLEGQPFVSGHMGRGLMNSCHGGDCSIGTLSSPPFVITRPFLCFQIAGSNNPLTRLELHVDGQVVCQTQGHGGSAMQWHTWDVSAWQGREAHVRAVDEAVDGCLLLDHIVLCNAPVQPAPLAEIALWADHGRDFYAPITFANMPDGRVIWLGWMSNWDYARQVPTAPWRGQFSGVRELDLVPTPRGLRLRQRPVQEMLALRSTPAWVDVQAQDANLAVRSVGDAVPESRQLMARLELAVPGLSAPIGFELFRGADHAVSVGYDPATRTFFIDRRTASPLFAGHSERHDAARLLDEPQLSLEVWIDGSTVELFADGGTVVISDLVFPSPQAMACTLFHGPENPLITRMVVNAVRATVHVQQH